MLSLRIDGVPAQSIGYGVVGDLEVQHRYSSTGGGLQVVSFKLACPPGYTHPSLRQGASVQVLRGPVSLGSARLADPDRDGWSFVADGLYRQAEHFTADGSTSPSAVVTAANSRGMGWNGVGNLNGASLSTTSETAKQLNTVADVLNEYARLNNMRWGLDVTNTPYMVADPTAVTLALTPGVPKMATAADDYASRVTVRYVSAVSGTPAAPSAWALASASTTTTPHGIRETFEDITNLGLLSGATATTYAQQILATKTARPAFTEAVEVAPTELTNLGGQPVAPWQSLTGQRIRHFGILDSDGQAAYGKTLEWVVGATTYRPSEGTLIVAPTELAARTVAQIQAKTAEATDDGFS